MNTVEEVLEEARGIFRDKRFQDVRLEPDGRLAVYFSGAYKLLTGADRVGYALKEVFTKEGTHE